jgi:FAD/FMN-containing dehydrogenase
MLTAGVALATLAITIIAVYVYNRPEPTVTFCSEADHELRLSRVLTSLQSRPPGSKLSLHRRTLESNTIRNATHKYQPTYFPVDLSSFSRIIRIDTEAGYLVCEPGISFGDLLKELLKVGMTTLVVPELPGITVGGAIAGGGLESSSHRHGQFSDTVLEIECLTPELRVCSPQVDPDLFYAISASYNTCALMTKVKLKIAPAPNYVSLKAVRYHDFEAAVQGLTGDEGSDTIEGIAYSAKEILVVRGKYTSTPASPIRYFTRHWDKWYYKTIRSTSEFTVPYYDYCFRYNYGSFWMADYVLDMLGGDNLLTRFLIGPLLDTKHLFAVLHSGTLTDLGRMRVIQDCYIPVEKASDFLQAEDTEMGVYPIWLCPIKGTSTPQVLASHYSPTNELFINVGLYGRPKIFPFDTRSIHSNLIDRLIEYGGRSMLYAQNWHTPDQFEEMYGTALQEVDTVRAKYGDKDCFFGLYEKVALSTRDRQELEKPMMGTEAAETRKVVLDIVKTYLGW